MIAPLPDDKRGHFIVGALLTLDVSILVSLLHLGPVLGLVSGVLAGLVACHLVAWLKEAYDNTTSGRHTAESLDALATIAGGAATASWLLFVIAWLWLGGVR